MTIKCPKCSFARAHYVESRRKNWGGKGKKAGFGKIEPRTNFNAACPKCGFKWSTQELELSKSLPEIKPVDMSEDDWKKFTEKFVQDTNAIEGSTITQEEVHKILEENKDEKA